MIFNLVEAAQEFLSEIVPAGQSQGSVRYSLYLIPLCLFVWGGAHIHTDI